jgi:pimeloyl-ACP methyl ester carboxylesterase
MLIEATALIIVLAFLAICVYFAHFITHSHRQPITRTPDNYAMKYEDVTFDSLDGIKLSGWHIPGASPSTVIVTHPFPFNKHGFNIKQQGILPLFDVDVDLLKTAEAIHAAGYTVLMFDFRNHGASGPGITGVGLYEWKDVGGALRYAEAHGAEDIGFVSFCMGANATITAMNKGRTYITRVRCLAAIQPVSAEVFVKQFMRDRFTSLSLALVPFVDILLPLFGGRLLEEMTPIPYAHSVGVPTLIAQAITDKWIIIQDTQAIHDAIPAPKELWWIKDITHRFNTYNYIGEHPEKLITFLETHLKK